MHIRSQSCILLTMFFNILMEKRLFMVSRTSWVSVFLQIPLQLVFFLKEKVFGLRMHRNKNLQQNLDEFKKVSITLASMDDEKIGDKSQEIILLSSLHESYRKVKVAIEFWRKTITLDESCCPLDHGKWI